MTENEVQELIMKKATNGEVCYAELLFDDQLLKVAGGVENLTVELYRLMALGLVKMKNVINDKGEYQ